MRDAIEPTRDPQWVLTHEGYNVVTETAVESRLSLIHISEPTRPY